MVGCLLVDCGVFDGLLIVFVELLVFGCVCFRVSLMFCVLGLFGLLLYMLAYLI